MITFLNSCVNPFLYGIYSPAFRAEYKEVLRKSLVVCRAGSGATAKVNIHDNMADVVPTLPGGHSNANESRTSQTNLEDSAYRNSAYDDSTV